MAEALYGQKELSALIEEDNIFEGVFSCLKRIWDNPGAIDDRQLGNSEYRTRKLEKILTELYPPLYDEMMDAVGNHPLPSLSSGCGIVLDSLSLREAFQLRRALSDDYRVEIDWAMIETLPSETKFICQEWFGAHGPSAVNQDNFQYIGQPKVPQLPDTNPAFVWSRFPDKKLHEAFRGNHTIEELSSIFEYTLSHLKDIMNESGHDKFLVTSDHGYVNHLGNNPYSMNDDNLLSALKSKFNGRFEEVANGYPYQLLRENNIIKKYEDHYLVAGHYNWRKRGASSKVMHGGLSLLECMTPVIEIRTD